jgi:hypothetical protein
MYLAQVSPERWHKSKSVVPGVDNTTGTSEKEGKRIYPI